MKTHKLLCMTFCIVLITACAKPPNTSTVDSAAALKQINDITNSKLGIDLRQLTELTRNADSDIILTSETSMKKDMLANLKALHKAGYITLSLNSASAETGLGNARFYKVQKTAKGKELARALSRL
jgi:hypothetical protein